MTRFQETRTIVTGAGSGIGQQIASQLIAEGAKVVAADLDTSCIPEGAIAVRTDVTVPDEVAHLVDTAVRELGGVDCLFSNAGVGSTTSVVDATVEEWDRVFAVNARGVFLSIKFALPAMLAQERGVIVNTASVAGLIGLPERASYSASKGAVIALTKQVAVQYAKAGIRCNCICPGTVDSPWVARLLEQSPDPARQRQELAARQPMGRLATPAEIAKAALYLASDDAAFITGTGLVIDGGIMAG